MTCLHAALFVLPFVLSSAISQAPERTAMVMPRVPIHTAAPDNGVAYGTWAAGDGYKVSFHDGMTFVPYLGADYSHNQPWSWRTTSVRVGNEELLAANATPAHRRGEFRYEYDFGPIVEAYDVRQDGLEQTFVLGQRPAAGDLVIRGAITSATSAAAAAPAHQELVFTDAEGRPILVYGKAWAIDANGVRLAMTTAHAGGIVTLTVPGDWLAAAALPVVVDPLLARSSLMASQPTFQRADIGRDDEAATYNLMCATTIAASQFDDDVRVIVSDDTANAIEVFSDITTSWDSDGASCAYVGGANRWAIVLRRYFGQSAIRQSLLRAHVHDSNSTVLSTSFTSLSNPVGLNDWRPDIGGVRSFQSGDDAMVVFQREYNTTTAGHWANTDDSAAIGVLLDVAGGGVFGVPFPIWQVLGVDVERPTVNQVAEGGASFSWLCAMQNYDHSIVFGDEWSVRARRITNNGTVANGTWWADPGFVDWQQLSPVIEGMHGRYLVAYAQADPVALPAHTGASRGRQLRVERIDWPHLSGPPLPSHPPVTLLTETADILETNGIAFDFDDRSHWTIGYRTVATAVPSAYGLRVGYRGQLTEGPVTLHSVAGVPTCPISCAYDESVDRFVFAYGINQSPTSRAYLHPFVYVTAAPTVSTGTNCHGTVVLNWQGNRQIGAEFNQLVATGTAPTDIHIVLVSLGAIDVPVVHGLVAPGCHLLVDTVAGYLGTMPIAIGTNAVFPLPLPEPLSPMTLHFQDWLLGSNGLLTSSQRLEVSIVK